MAGKGSIISSAVATTATAPAAPGNVTSLTAVATHQLGKDFAGNPRATDKLNITITFNVPAVLGTFKGVHAQVYAPDQTATPTMAFDGTTALDGTNEFHGPPTPTAEATKDCAVSAGAQDSLVITIEDPKLAMDIRVRVISYSLYAENDQNSAPSYVISYTPGSDGPTKPASGVEWAPCAASFALAADNPVFGQDAKGNPTWQATFDFTNATDDLRYSRLGYYQLVIDYEDGTRIGPYGPFSIDSLKAATPVWPVGAPQTFTAWLQSADIEGHENTIVPTITPSVRFLVDEQLGAAGEEYAPLVTNPYAPSVVPTRLRSGVVENYFDPTWEISDDSRYGGLQLVFRKTSDSTDSVLTGTVPKPEETTAVYFAAPKTIVAGTLYFVSVDSAGRRNSIVDSVTPKVSIQIGTTAGTIDLGRPVAGTYDADIFSSAGEIFKQIKVDLSIPKAGTYDPNVFSNAGGLFNFKYDSAQFDTASGHLKLNALDASSVTISGTIKVGGLGATGLYVYDNAAALIGWVGTNGGLYGGWFKRLWVGGTSPANAQMYTDSSGNATFAGTLAAATISAITIAGSQIISGTVQVGGTGATGVYVYDGSASLIGWIGTNGGLYGGWFKQFWAGGTNPATAKVYIDGSGNANFSGNVASSTITSSTVTLNLNNVTSTFGNAFDSNISEYAGFKIRDNISAGYITGTALGFTVFNTDDTQALVTLRRVSSGSGAHGRLTLNNGLSTHGVILESATPRLMMDGIQVVTVRQSAVTAPTGGTTVDSQARTAINDIISRLQSHGMIS